MNMIQTRKFLMNFGLFLIFLGLILIFVGTIIPSEVSKIKGDCFDKYGNKINGVTCDIKQDNLSYGAVGLVIIFLGVLSYLPYKMMEGI